MTADKPGEYRWLTEEEIERGATMPKDTPPLGPETRPDKSKPATEGPAPAQQKRGPVETVTNRPK